MRDHDTGTILFIVGTSSAGKSSTIRVLQELLPEHYLSLGIDTFFHMVSPRWGGGLGGPLSIEGFRYISHIENQFPVIRIAYGSVGSRILRGMHRAVAALAQSGNNLLVDEMLLDASVLDDWITVLYPLPVCIIRLNADLQVLEQREFQRGNTRGLARGHYQDNLIDAYDLNIDTGAYTPEEVAQVILEHLYSNTEWTALNQLYLRKKQIT
jgi:chloramphenicol 3-O phosphotransferase